MLDEISHAQFRAVIESAVEGIITINKNGEILMLNPSAEKIFGYQCEEILNEKIQILMPEPYKSEHDSYISRYRSSKKAKIIGKGREVTGLRKNGEKFPMWITLAEFYKDGEQYFSGFINDLTTEKLILKKARGYEFILEHSLNEIYIFNSKSLKFIHVNQGALNNLQYSHQEILDKTPIDIKPELSLSEFKKIIKPLEDGKINKIIFSTTHQRKDGSRYPVEVHLEMTEFVNQKVFVAIILNISERVAAQERERINEEQLAHMDRISIYGELAAGIAHEVNQPLTAISSYATAGLHRIEADEYDVQKLKQLFKKIDTAAHRTSDVITRLRKMLKPKNEEMEHLNINKVIYDAIDMIRADSRASSFQFKLKLADTIPEVLGDSVQLQQVILNLIRNSMDASNPMDADEQVITISSEEIIDENRIKVSIKDAGSGISDEIENDIFTPFKTTKEFGMGVGLSICQTIIQSHNGRLWYTKNEVKGTTFHFTILTVMANDHG